MFFTNLQARCRFLVDLSAEHLGLLPVMRIDITFGLVPSVEALVIRVIGRALNQDIFRRFLATARRNDPFGSRDPNNRRRGIDLEFSRFFFLWGDLVMETS